MSYILSHLDLFQHKIDSHVEHLLAFANNIQLRQNDIFPCIQKWMRFVLEYIMLWCAKDPLIIMERNKNSWIDDCSIYSVIISLLAPPVSPPLTLSNAYFILNEYYSCTRLTSYCLHEEKEEHKKKRYHFQGSVYLLLHQNVITKLLTK